MTQKLNPFSGRQFLDANGDPYSGAKLFTYLEGTSTKQTVTKDEAGSSNHTNPIILNSKGEPADSGGSAQAIWQPDGTAIKLVLAPSDDTDPPASAIASWDNIEGINDTVGSGGASEWVEGPTPTYVNATSFTLVGDQSSTFHVGRRVKTTNSGGTVYGTITAVAYTTLTTVTVRNDTSSLDSGLSAVSYSLLSSENNAIPANIPTLENVITLPATCGGAADAYTVDLKETAYVSGRVYSCQIQADNTGASTINISGLGTKNIKLFDGNDPHAGALKNGFVHYFLYNGTNMVLLNPEITQAGGLIQSAAIDWANIIANYPGLFQYLWSNYTATNNVGTGSFSAEETFYLYIPPEATTLNYRFHLSTDGTIYARLTGPATGTTTTSTATGWDTEIETIDISGASGWTEFTIEAYRNGGSFGYVWQMAAYME